MDLAPFMADSSDDTERSVQIRAWRRESRSRADESGSNRGRNCLWRPAGRGREGRGKGGDGRCRRAGQAQGIRRKAWPKGISAILPAQRGPAPASQFEFPPVSAGTFPHLGHGHITLLSCRAQLPSGGSDSGRSRRRGVLVVCGHPGGFHAKAAAAGARARFWRIRAGRQKLKEGTEEGVYRADQDHMADKGPRVGGTTTYIFPVRGCGEVMWCHVTDP